MTASGPNFNLTRQRAIRIAHLTDIHVQPERDAPSGFAACLSHVHQLVDPPVLILNGGDSVMDTVSSSIERAHDQWDAWTQTVNMHCTLQMVHCLGNHDLWGTNRRRSGCSGSEPLYAKGLPMERLGLVERYRSFDRAGWRFIILDSNYTDSEGRFTARLDNEQFDWLSSTLAATPPDIHILIMSHIPILAGASVFFTGHEGEDEHEGDWIVPAQWMHVDARRLSGLFSRHRNVRLCISGHTHLVDRMDFRGVTYLNNGSVSGRWWRGEYMDTPAGYALIDLFDDGTFHHEYIPTGWTPLSNTP